MKILKRSGGMTQTQLYDLVRAENAGNMKDMISQEIEVRNFCFYETVDSKGDPKRALAIETPEHEVIVTNSPTFMEDFDTVIEIFWDDVRGVKISVSSATSANKREFITCRYAA
jgi:hypothetical protein